MASWPSSLPQSPEQSGYSEEAQDQAIASQTTIGEAKYRRRYTKENEILNCTFLMTGSQVSTFKTFYNTTLSGGVDTYDWTHPRTGNSETFRFRRRGRGKAPYKIVNVSGDQYRVSIIVETT